MVLIHDASKKVQQLHPATLETISNAAPRNTRIWARDGSARIGLLLSLAAFPACHVHDVASVSSSSGTTGADSTSAASLDTGTSTGTTTSGADSTGVENSTGESPASCLAINQVDECVHFPAPTEPYATQAFEMSFLDAAEVCPCTYELLSGTLESIFVQHPVGWPDEPATAPVIVFHHGNGQSANNYDFAALATAGFVVLNVETGNGGAATFGLLCALELAASEALIPDTTTSWADATDCNAVVSGHSVGGEQAGSLLAGGIDPSVIETLSHVTRPYVIRGGILLAPALRTDSLVGGPVPLLIVPTPTDEEIGTQIVTRYDRAPLEVEFSSSELPRAMIYPWGTSHSAFGGHDPFFPTRGRSRGQAIVDGYLPPFAAATVFADPSSRATWWSYLTRESYPPAVLDPELWDDLDPFTIQSPVHCASVNSVDCATTPGCEVSGSDCVQVDCSEVATIDCAATPGCVVSANDECMHPPRLRTAYTSEQGGPGNHQRQPIGEFFENHTVPEHGGALQVVVDEAATVIANIDFTIDGAPTGHETSLMLVEWGPLEGGELAIELPDVDLNEYSHLSLRVGNVLDKTSGGNVACAVASSDAVSFELGLREVVAGQTNSESGFVSTGRIVQNDTAYLTSQGVAACRGEQTMNTVRFPLAPFCSGLGSSVANQLILRFPELVDTSRVLIDTIELTRAPLDSLAVCGTLAAAWNCEIDELAVTETACSDEPIVAGGTAACDPGDVTTTALDAPPLCCVTTRG